MLPVNRDIVYQNFETFALTVLVTPTQISTAFTKIDLIDSFAVCVDAAAANNIFIGNANVTVNTGLEIVRGVGPVNFVIRNQTQRYELQEPLIAMQETMQCQGQPIPRAIPFIVWDLSQIYLVAAANTVARISPFRAMFI